MMMVFLQYLTHKVCVCVYTTPFRYNLYLEKVYFLSFNCRKACCSVCIKTPYPQCSKSTLLGIYNDASIHRKSSVHIISISYSYSKYEDEDYPSVFMKIKEKDKLDAV